MFRMMSGFWRRIIEVVVGIVLDYLEKKGKKSDR